MSFGQTPKDAGGIPLSCVIAPGTSTPIALQGSTNTTTDANSNVTTPANMNITQIASVTQVLDNTNIPRASIYGKATNPGDTSFLLDSSGRLLIDLRRIGGINVQMAGSDGVTAGNVLQTIGGLYNGSTIDQVRGNLDNITLINAVNATTTQFSPNLTNYNARGVIVVLNMTNVGTGSVTINIKGSDPVSGQHYTILAGGIVTTNVANIYRVYPGLTTVGSATANDILPRSWLVSVTANNANPTTYTVSAMYVL